MSMFCIQKRTFVASLVSIAAVAIVSCEQARVDIDAADLDSQSPFGFEWETFHVDGERIDHDPRDACAELIDQIKGIVGLEDRKIIIRKCAQEKYATLFVSNYRLPEFFRSGELSVMLRGESEPVLFNYAFLHRVLPDDDSRNKRRRISHARIIREELNKRYGPPNKVGYYDQGNEAGFSPGDDKNAPCEFWLQKNIGILLCSERVVLIDGVEMSLSFTKLDRAPNGESLLCAVSSPPTHECMSASNRKIEEDIVSVLELLADWLGPKNFRLCTSESIEPIEAVWALTDSEKEELKDVLETYSGDGLAQYAIDYANEASSDLPGKTRDKILMFLFHKAALQGSAVAMNEIGASLLYCYQNVQSDLLKARYWLEKAAAGGDVYAMNSLALMHLSGMTDDREPVEAALRLLERCDELEADTCASELNALKWFIAFKDKEI